MSVTTALTYAHPHYYGHDPGWWWVGGIIRLLLVALIVFLIIRLVLWRRRGACGPPWRSVPDPADPTRILAERYARGEIDGGEYRERLAMLGGKPPNPSS